MKAEQISIFNYMNNPKNDIDKIDIFKIMHKIEIKDPPNICFYTGDYLKKEKYNNDLQNDKTL